MLLQPSPNSEVLATFCDSKFLRWEDCFDAVVSHSESMLITRKGGTISRPVGKGSSDQGADCNGPPAEPSCGSEDVAHVWVGVSMAFGPEHVFQGRRINREPREARGRISNHQGQAHESLARNSLRVMNPFALRGDSGLDLGVSPEPHAEPSFRDPGASRRRGGLPPISPIFPIAVDIASGNGGPSARVLSMPSESDSTRDRHKGGASQCRTNLTNREILRPWKSPNS